MRRKTIAVRGPWRPEEEPATLDVEPPLHLSTVYKYPPYEKPLRPRRGEVKYGRENNPTVMLFEEQMAALESGGWSLAFNSGMSALSTLFLFYPGYRRIVLQRVVYGSSRTLAERLSANMGKKTLTEGPPWEELLSSIGEGDLVVLETLGNPTLRVPPLDAVVDKCTGRGCAVVVDNTMATPILHRPLEHGAALVLESASKYISGHNDVLAGILAGVEEEYYQPLWEGRRLLGTHLQPLDTYLVMRGLKTLHVRVRESSRSAMAVAEWLESQDEVERVYYPGLESHPDHENALVLFKEGLYGAVVSFELKGGRRRAEAFLEHLRLIVPTASFGGVETMISYPYMASHRSLSEEEKRLLGVTPGLLRLSIGLEDVRDIIYDIETALRETRGAR